MSYALQGIKRYRPPRYWAARARAKGFSGLGVDQTAMDVRSAVDVIAGLISNPDATLRRYGPALVTAVDRHVLTALINKLAAGLAPYMYKYVLPPLSVLYILGGVSAYYSFRADSNTRRSSVKANRRRRRRRTSRRR